MINFILLSALANAVVLDLPDSFTDTFSSVRTKGGIQAVVISSPKSTQASVSLSIAVGSLQDPIPGLAHFLEHMIFYSSENYPEQQTLSKFLAANGGSSNAFTEPESTNFYFTVKSQALEESLAIFGDLIASPIFDQDAVDRELNAVNSELMMNINDDEWRNQRLQEILANPDHPYSHFKVGSFDTLTGDLVPILKEFHQLFYVTGNIKLAIYSPFEVNKMNDWVLEYFENIQQGIRTQFHYPVPYDTPGKVILAPKISSGSTLHIFWALPSQYAFVDENPASFIVYLLDNDGINGIQNNYKADISHFFVSSSSTYSDFTLFQVKVEMIATKYWKQITADLHAYMEMMLKSSKKTLTNKWNEYSQISKLLFMYQDKPIPKDLVIRISQNMQNMPERNYLSGFDLPKEFNYDRFKAFASQLQPDRAFTIILSDQFYQGRLFNGQILKLNHKEPNYGIDYEIRNIQINQSSSIFALPNYSDVIPKDLSLLNLQQQSSLKSIGEKKWFCFDSSFQLPKIIFNLLVVPKNRDLVFQDFHSYILDATVRSTLHKYLKVGFQFYVSPEARGLNLQLIGWRNGIADFKKKVVNLFLNPGLDYFEASTITLENTYKSFEVDQSYIKALQYLNRLIIQGSKIPEEKLLALQNITQKSYLDYLKTLTHSKTETLVVGNILEKQAIKLATIYGINSPDQFDSTIQIVNVNKSSIFTQSSQDNHCIVNWYDLGEFTIKNDILNQIFVMKADNDSFQYLRTRYQLGYVVNVGIPLDFFYFGFVIIVQGSQKNPAEMNDYIKKFWDEFSFTEQDLQEYSEGLMNKLSQPDASIIEMNNRFWKEILLSRYQFDIKTKELEGIKQISIEQIEEILKLVRSGDGILSIRIFKDSVKFKKGIGLNDLQEFEKQIQEQ